MSPEAQAVIDAACKSVDLDRAWWDAKQESQVARLGDMLGSLLADARRDEATAAVYRHAAVICAAVDAYRASKAGTP